MCHRSLCKSLVAWLWHSDFAIIQLMLTYLCSSHIIFLFPWLKFCLSWLKLQKLITCQSHANSGKMSPHSALCLCWLQPNLYVKLWTKKITLAFKTLCWIKIKSILIIVIIKRGSISSHIMELEFLPNLKLLEAPPSGVVAKSVRDQ